ncbi:ComF family protein [Desulfofundulus thermosubterraneus]|uniref:ComF family protein n=1 Tax=Desulfofundulus thermosubterraneus DSM 16057 TaxID=1121432 RepID=A0A1M6I2C5_9FIRM|nr:ComF family protein [Desulfofundulus thermosubterraneus]SHJ28585.1 comF family protein [Desulfofundulus thermosubterraneus DSM 16057]
MRSEKWELIGVHRLLIPLRELWSDFLDLLFPPSRGCPLCGAAAEDGELCSRCRKMFLDNRMPVGCTICGCFQRPSGKRTGTPGEEPGGSRGGDLVTTSRANGRGGAPSPHLLCPRCESGRPPFNAARAAGPYEGVLKEAILRLKFRRERGLARPLGLFLAAVARELVPPGTLPLVVPVPLSRKRLAARGFNQAECLARELSLTLGWPLVPVLRKVRETPPQTGLSRADRLSNLSGTFAVVPDVLPPGRVVLLVDDVFTTGSTARECTRALLASGAAAVYVVTVAAPFCSRNSTAGLPEDA